MEYSNSRKSRDQRFFEFFITLQKEYIVAEIRKKIYPDIKGKEKSEEIMKGKKRKIYDMAVKNSLKTIFPDMKVGEVSLYDEQLRIDLYREIYGDCDFPNFIYRDDVQKQRLGFKDRKCYYSVGSDFKTPNGIGILEEVNLDDKICQIKIKDEVISFMMSEISRIL